MVSFTIRRGGGGGVLSRRIDDEPLPAHVRPRTRRTIHETVIIHHNTAFTYTAAARVFPIVLGGGFPRIVFRVNAYRTRGATISPRRTHIAPYVCVFLEQQRRRRSRASAFHKGFSLGDKKMFFSPKQSVYNTAVRLWYYTFVSHCFAQSFKILSTEYRLVKKCTVSCNNNGRARRAKRTRRTRRFGHVKRRPSRRPLRRTPSEGSHANSRTVGDKVLVRDVPPCTSTVHRNLLYFPSVRTFRA